MVIAPSAPASSNLFDSAVVVSFASALRLVICAMRVVPAMAFREIVQAKVLCRHLSGERTSKLWSFQQAESLGVERRSERNSLIPLKLR